LIGTGRKGDPAMSEIIVFDTSAVDEPVVLEEIEVEELAVDGICGVY
jgi:mycofactocin precursor